MQNDNSKIKFIDETDIIGKRILLRLDLNVSLNKEQSSIADDARIRQSISTIEFLLKKKNKLIIVSHLDRPKGRDSRLSLQVVVDRLQEYLPSHRVWLIDDFMKENPSRFLNQRANDVFVLENIRFYPEEKKNDAEFSRKLASVAEIFVNDAFAVSHRAESSVVGVTSYLPSYGGLLLKKEIEMITKTIRKPKKPFVAIIGGAKIDTKINLINKLTEIADYVLIGGGLANTFLCAHEYEIGKSYCEYEKVAKARQLLFLAAQKHTAVVLPSDVVIGDPANSVNGGEVKKVNEIPEDASILDIGPETKAKFGAIIAKARTIIWNGPVGYFENPAFRRGTDFIYYAIAHNKDAVSIVGGGDTLAAISKKEHLDAITHVSTGGGAMLEFIEKGVLPGIEALKNS